jgi:ribonuclease HI
MSYYAVPKGFSPGIYRTWQDAKKQVDRFHKPIYKKFATEKEALNFMSQHEAQPKSKPVAITNFFVKEDPKENENTLIVFTDGSAINNGMKNCRSGYGLCFPEHRELDHSAAIVKGTNNRAEYSALVKAIELADGLDAERKKTLIVYTDSMLLINTITKWMGSWKRNDWKKSDGYTVSNLDLVKRIDELLAVRKVSLNHVKAHTGEDTWEARYNDIVDKLAKVAARGN